VACGGAAATRTVGAASAPWVSPDSAPRISDIGCLLPLEIGPRILAMNEDRWFWMFLIAVAFAWLIGGYVSASPVLARWLEPHDMKRKFSDDNVTMVRGNSTICSTA
jgi:hypothetical protein